MSFEHCGTEVPINDTLKSEVNSESILDILSVYLVFQCERTHTQNPVGFNGAGAQPLCLALSSSHTF